MKKTKFIPAMLMLVFCIGLITAGVYAMTPASNTIAGTVVVNAAGASVELTGYIDGSDTPAWGPFTTRQGAPEPWELSAEDLTFDLTTKETFTDADLQKTLTIKIRNLSSQKELGAYFYTGEGLDEDNFATADSIKVLEPLVNEGDEDPFANIYLSSYSHMMKYDGDAATNYDTVEMQMCIRLADVLESSKTDSFTLTLNIEDYQPNVTSLSAGSAVNVDSGYEDEPDTLYTSGNKATTNFIKLSSQVTSIPDYAYLSHEGRIGFDGYDGALTAVTENLNIKYIVLTGNVQSIGLYAFGNIATGYGTAGIIEPVAGLKGISIPSSVRSIGSYAFRYCEQLVTVTISEKLETSSAIIGSYAFYGCTSLTSITIPEGVKTIDSCAFYDCTSLTSVTILEGVTTINRNAFYGCTSLTSVTIPSSVTTIDLYVFSDSSSAIFNVAEDNPNYSSDFQGALYDKNKTTLMYGRNIQTFEVPEGVTTIGTYAFKGRTSLTSVTIPSSVTAIDYEAFKRCNSALEATYDGTMAEFQAITGYAYLSDNAVVHCTDGDL